ncbi:MAG: restriction endonuclease [Spirochaetota bacterium]
MKQNLTLELLRNEAQKFSNIGKHSEHSLYGITDGKAVGTYLEHKFQKYLHQDYDYTEGSSAKGIDFPELMVDMKVTNIAQPQSSCPFQSARQKIYGLGYNLLVFVYEKEDNHARRIGHLNILHTIFIENYRTADFQTTTGINGILQNHGNKDDIRAFFEERLLPVDEIQANILAEEIISNPPAIGYLTISNALQWRLQYSRVIQHSGTIDGIMKVL